MSEMFEKIGEVSLNLENYGGQDLYSDGNIEDMLLDAVKNNPPSDYKKVIEDSALWPYLYHLSDIRENIVEWIDIKKTDKVLEVGSGCGAITGVLSAKAGEVTCVDLSKKRSLINAYRHRDAKNITVCVGNFTDVEPGLSKDYDLIFLIGVLEYGICYIPGDEPFEEFLKIIRKHLKPDGRVVIAIENRLGMKYFAGCREDHLGTFFSGLENYREGDNVRTFSKPALETLVKKSGFEECHFYYPYPDYKLPTTVFSDQRLPKPGELVTNNLNFDRDRVTLFDEKKVYDSVIADGLFPVFSNSFLVVLGKKPETDYVRYSNDRSKRYAIKTEIIEGDTPVVRKTALYPEGADHIKGLFKSFEKLSEKYAGSELNVAPVRISGEDRVTAGFEYVKGTPLSMLFDDCLKKEDRRGFEMLYSEFERRTAFNENYPFADTDLVFSNVIVDGDKWTLIDYEWTVEKAVSSKKQALRALFCYMLERDFKCFEGLTFLKILTEATDTDIEEIISEEALFQKEVTENSLSLGQIREKIGHNNVNFSRFEKELVKAGSTDRVQIYCDRGAGYSEADSYFVKNARFEDGEIEVETNFAKDVVNLRLDPMNEACIVYVDKLTVNGKEIPATGRKVDTNGKKLRGKGAGFLFSSTDPNINIHLSGTELSENNSLYAKLRYVKLGTEIAADLSENIKRIF